MSDEKVITNDLFGFAKPQQAEIQNRNDVHFSAKGSRVLAEKVAKEILGALIVRKKAGERGKEGERETKQTSSLERLKHNNPGLIVDLGVGLWAWPVPCDADGDGDFDLIVSCPDKPYNGAYLFENPGGGQNGRNEKFPVFKPARRLSAGQFNVTPSYVDGRLIVTTPGNVHPDFLTVGLDKPQKLSLLADPIGKNPDWFKPHKPGVYKLRHNQWKFVDYDGDKALDLVVALENWSEYGWDDAWDSSGQWKNGPLHGLLYLFRNTGSTEQPKYAEPKLIEAAGAPQGVVDTFGLASPNFADFDGDGDLDLLCGEFLDGFTYFQNVGSRAEPKYAAGKPLMREGRELTMDLEMIVPVAFDWDADGDLDLIVGDEDGRVALVENYGPCVDGVPQFLTPKYFKQEADDVKFGALATTCGFDWDGDGDTDIIAGNTAGYIAFIENLSGPGVESPRWAAPDKLEAAGETIRIMAGPNGSIQGPAEAKWGYTTQTVADWDHDGLPDLIVNSIWGKVVWYRNVGTRTQPELAASQSIQVMNYTKHNKPEWTWWEPNEGELVTQWRTTPVAIDFNNNGLCDLVMLDQEGYLTFFERVRRKKDGQPFLQQAQRRFIDENGKPLQLNAKRAGGSGRRKLSVVDWDGDGKLDVLLNGVNANLLRQVEKRDADWVMKDMGPLDARKIEGHDTSPTTVDWNNDGVPDLLVGAEDGRFYYLKNVRAATTTVAQADAVNDDKAKTPSPQPSPPSVQSQRQAGAREQDKAILKTEFLYETAPTPSCHASTIVETKDGLVAAWFGGTYEKHPDVGIWFSRLVDGKWSTPVEVANGVESPEKRHPCWNPILFQPALAAGGKKPEQPLPLMLFYKVGPSPDTWWGMLITSDDAGRTWSKPHRLPDGILGPVKNKPIQLPNGDILCGTSSEHDGWRVHFERSSDLGQTWKATAPVNDGKQIGAIQPSFLVHKDGRLQAVGRTQQKQVFEVSSTDGGLTWGPLTLTSLPNPNAGTDAVTLADGRHLIVYNHTPRGRSPLNVAVSTDSKEWQAALVLESDPGEYSYPAVIQASDGLIHFTYTWKRQRVKHVVVDPKQLTPMPMLDGKWPE
ncbi:MAG: exo-alpha-sialidase [Candidatus Saccharimonas sp.]|nr:exo-alpha-sialidase [Planctomycetaceae bacterium]